MDKNEWLATKGMGWVNKETSYDDNGVLMCSEFNWEPSENTDQAIVECVLIESGYYNGR